MSVDILYGKEEKPVGPRCTTDEPPPKVTCKDASEIVVRKRDDDSNNGNGQGVTVSVTINVQK